MTLDNLDLIAGWAGLVLTLMVFSYLLADNFLYRIAVHILVGATAAYIAVAAVEEVLIPWFDLTLLNDSGDTTAGTRALGAIPLLFGILLLLKASPRLAPFGNLGSVFMIGVGTAVALVGAVIGTVLPLARDAGESLDDQSTINGLIMLTGTLCTLLYFQYLSRRRADREPGQRLPLRILQGVGQGFIAVTLGALYAGVMATSLSIFSTVVNEQLRFLLEQIGG